MITSIKLYNGELEIFFDSFRHRYTLDNVVIPSVTSALGMIAKPALINWSANTAVDYIASQIEPGMTYDELQLQAIFNAGRKAHFQKKVDAGNIGTFVHKWVEDYIKGNNPEMPVNDMLKASVNKFLEWVEKNHVKFLASEQVVYSKEFRYVGTLDFICKVGGLYFIGDLKTSSGIWDEYKLQTAAYRHARVEEFPNEDYAGQLIVRVGKEGDFDFKVIEDYQYPDLFDGFIHALNLSRAMEKVKTFK